MSWVFDMEKRPIGRHSSRRLGDETRLQRDAQRRRNKLLGFLRKASCNSAKCSVGCTVCVPEFIEMKFYGSWEA